MSNWELLLLEIDSNNSYSNQILVVQLTIPHPKPKMLFIKILLTIISSPCVQLLSSIIWHTRVQSCHLYELQDCTGLFIILREDSLKKIYHQKS